MKPSFNIATSPDFMGKRIFSFLNHPKQEIGKAFQWKTALSLFALGIAAREIIHQLAFGSGAPSPFSALLGGFVGALFWRGTLLFLWAWFVDLAAQMRGYEGRFPLLTRQFFAIYGLEVFIVPIGLFFWGLQESAEVYISIWELVLLILMATLQIKTISLTYQVMDHEPGNIFFFPIVLTMIWFFISLFVLGIQISTLF